MSFKCGALLPVMALVLTGCGSDGNDDFNGQPFVRFTVNAVQDATSVTVSRVHTEVDNVNEINRCNDIEFSSGQTLTYNNGDSVTDAKYCRDKPDDENLTVERNILASPITFGVQFFNNTYENLSLSYQGNGFTVTIYEYDEVAEDNLGDLVWHSDHYFQTEIEAERATGTEIDDFDPSLQNSIVLSPSQAFPVTNSPSDVGRRVIFRADQNFIGRPAMENYNFDALDLYHWPSVNNDGMPGQCDWFPVEAEDSTDTNRVFEKVICLGYSLLPVPESDQVSDVGSSVYPFVSPQDADGNIRYVARIEYSFDFGNGVVPPPEDVLITVAAPAE